MKTYKLLVLCTFVAIQMLTACSSPKEPEKPEVPLQLHVRLPSVIAGHPGRLARFQNKVRFLTLSLAADAMPSREFHFPPGNWETLRVGIPPSEENETWRLRIEVWDHRQDGYPRSYPVMTGEKNLRIQPGSKSLEVSLALALQVSVENYD